MKISERIVFPVLKSTARGIVWSLVTCGVCLCLSLFTQFRVDVNLYFGVILMSLLLQYFADMYDDYDEGMLFCLFLVGIVASKIITREYRVKEHVDGHYLSLVYYVLCLAPLLCISVRVIFRTLHSFVISKFTSLTQLITWRPQDKS